jgi:hypothetical protein
MEFGVFLRIRSEVNGGKRRFVGKLGGQGRMNGKTEGNTTGKG